MSIYDSLKCYDVTRRSFFEKKRIGRNNDGGYVIIHSNIEYDCLIGAGINNDISFENDFLRIHPKVSKSFVFDGTIQNKFPVKRSALIRCIDKNIGIVDSKTTDTLVSYSQRFKTIFLKMDIEGSEYDWINHFPHELWNSFAQIVIEFHQSYENKCQPAFAILSRYFYLTNVHINNYCAMKQSPFYKVDGQILPRVFECTYINKNLFPNWIPELNRLKIPMPLDQPNRKNHPDIEWTDIPFVLK